MQEIPVRSDHVRKLLAAGDGDAALLYLCCAGGGSPEQSGLSAQRVERASALLRQLGVWENPAPRFQQAAERPVYSEQDVTRRMKEPQSGFRELVGETQRRLGRILNTEELKVLLAMTDYLGLSPEVISMLLSYCITRSRSRGAGRAPSFRSREKEAYRWADEGIDNIEAAAAYVQAQNLRSSRVGQVCALLGLEGRRLTAAEEKYILSWLDMGFPMEVLQLAFEKTCVNTGSLKWPYMNSILKSWDSQGLHTLAQIERSDRPAAKSARAQRGGEFQRHGETPRALGRQAAARLLAKQGED